MMNETTIPDADEVHAVIALHKYYMWANRMREHFTKTIPSLPAMLTPEQSPVFMVQDPIIFMSYWYAGLFVVIEGWNELELIDPQINELLESPHVDLLRRYRNGVCHYQREYADPRFLDMMQAKGVVPWVKELNNAFGRYFMAKIKALTAQGYDIGLPGAAGAGTESI
jgi:hypothetical protein